MLLKYTEIHQENVIHRLLILHNKTNPSSSFFFFLNYTSVEILDHSLISSCLSSSLILQFIRIRGIRVSAPTHGRSLDRSPSVLLRTIDGLPAETFHFGLVSRRGNPSSCRVEARINLVLAIIRSWGLILDLEDIKMSLFICGLPYRL